MRGVQMSENGPSAAKGLLAELNQYKEDEKKEVRGGVAGEGHGLSEEDELRIHEDTKNVNGRHSAAAAVDRVQVQSHAEAHKPQQQTHAQPQPQGHVVRWDRFLPVRSLKVLLVEYDDSTRHVVSALLRNCSYEVTAVPNGLEAWKILEDINNPIDLILTEVVMPGLSGIGLLSKIMSHKSRQNVPVIMMSSYDAMGIVLKCLSKGAVDFLVKPIRKNELKNLWQHVWRKCHSSSGSGSESGIRTEKSIGVKNVQSDNDTGSNDEDDYRSNGLQVRDGSDNGSGTQSSWTKRAAEVESPQPMSPWDEQADPPDSTCAQVIYPKPEAFASSWVPVAAEDRRDNQLDNVSMGKDLEIGIPRNSDTRLKGPSKKVIVANAAEKSQSSQSDLKKDGRKFDKEKLEINNEKSNGEWIKQDANLPGNIVSEKHRRGSIGSEVPEICKSKDKVTENVKDLPSLELSLKRLHDVTDTRNDVLEQNILRHSELSAFSRYNTGSTANQGQTGNVGSCSPLDNSSEAAKQSNSDSTPPNQNSNSGSNNNDMGSTTDRSFRKPVIAPDKPPAKSTDNSSPHLSAFQSEPKSHVSNPQLLVSDKGGPGPVNESDAGQQVQIQHHHHYHHYHHHHVHNVHHRPTHDDDLSLKDTDVRERAQQCGSSNTEAAQIEAKAANGSLNGSACGSNYGSNLNGSSAGGNVEGMNMMINDNGVAVKDGGPDNNGSGSGSGSGSRIGVEQSRSAQREAALHKFRQKRKERCFEKKVRYQSRKKLAEQRPRVRGQFVRQVQDVKEEEDADS